MPADKAGALIAGEAAGRGGDELQIAAPTWGRAHP